MGRTSAGNASLLENRHETLQAVSPGPVEPYGEASCHCHELFFFISSYQVAICSSLKGALFGILLHCVILFWP